MARGKGNNDNTIGAVPGNPLRGPPKSYMKRSTKARPPNTTWMKPPLNPRIVSWLSFAVMAILVALFGLLGNHQIVSSLERQFIAERVAHARAVAAELAPLLQPPTPDALGAFDARAPERIRYEGYYAGVIDLQTPQVLALAGHQPADNAAAAETAQRMLRTVAMYRGDPPVAAWTVHDRWPELPVLLTYFQPIAGAPDWLLVVESDVSEQISTMHGLHYRISGLLVLSIGLVATIGILVLRRLGRVYERYLEDSLRRRTAELESAHAEMLSQARLVTLGQTASMLAHELRNPLASLKLGLSGLGGAEGLAERDRHRLRLVLREVDRLEGLLSGALNVVRPVRFAAEPVHLDRLIDHVQRLIEPALAEHGMELQRHVCRECPPTRLDPNQMEQVLLNLLKNAIEASPPGATIGLALMREGDWLQVEITNVGAPIPPEAIARLFEPFYTTKPKGTGLGLAMVKRVIDEHGGQVRVASDAAGETRFAVRLPVAPARPSVAPPPTATDKA
jgi:signal transduction histidine kinase